MILHLGETATGASEIILPGVMEVESGAMVDEPEPPVPEQKIGVAGRTIHIGDEGIEPDDLRGEIAVELVCVSRRRSTTESFLGEAGAKRQRTRQEIQGQVQSTTGLE